MSAYASQAGGNLAANKQPAARNQTEKRAALAPPVCSQMGTLEMIQTNIDTIAGILSIIYGIL